MKKKNHYFLGREPFIFHPPDSTVVNVLVPIRRLGELLELVYNFKQANQLDYYLLRHVVGFDIYVVHLLFQGRHPSSAQQFFFLLCRRRLLYRIVLHNIRK